MTGIAQSDCTVEGSEFDSRNGTNNIWNENQLMSLFQFYLYIAGSLHVSGPQVHPQESSHSCSHNHWFSEPVVV